LSNNLTLGYPMEDGIFYNLVYVVVVLVLIDVVFFLVLYDRNKFI
jgi:hypothetical protein